MADYDPAEDFPSPIMTQPPFPAPTGKAGEKPRMQLGRKANQTFVLEVWLSAWVAPAVASCQGRLHFLHTRGEARNGCDQPYCLSLFLYLPSYLS